jgi:hypothetical protein
MGGLCYIKKKKKKKNLEELSVTLKIFIGLKLSYIINNGLPIKQYHKEINITLKISLGGSFFKGKP